MKNLFKVFGIIALVAVIGFSIIACDDDPRDPVTYTGTANGVTYTLRIEAGGSRAVLTPAQGDQYTLTQTANSKQSTGKVTKVVGGVLTLEPSGDPEDEFTATVSGNGITAMDGTITWDDGTANTAPTTFTPPANNPNPGTGGPTNWTAVADSTFGDSNIGAITYGNNKFVAGAYNGKIAYSTDNGVTWIAVADSTFTSKVSAIAYGNSAGNAGRFVAVGDKIAYSDDGVTWTAVTGSIFGAGTTTDIRAIAYGNGKFVVGDFRGRTAYSTDNGVTWTAVTDITFGTIQINAIAYGNSAGNAGRFVAVGDSANMAYSDDGENWTAVNSPFNDHVFAITYANNKFVAGGWGGKIATSSDGAIWTAVADSILSSGALHVKAIAYGDGRFAAGGWLGRIAYSADGVTWTTVADSKFGGSDIDAIAYGGGRFVAVGNSGKMAYADWSGTGGNIFQGTPTVTAMAASSSSITVSWTSVPGATGYYVYRSTSALGAYSQVEKTTSTSYTDTGLPANTTRYYKVAAYNSSLTGAESSFSSATTLGTNTGSSDMNWIPVTGSALGTGQIDAIAYGSAGNRFVAGGNGGRMAYSDDGITWTALPSSTFSIWSSPYVYGIAYGGGKFVAVGNGGRDGGKIVYSPDGVTWTAVENSPFVTDFVYAVTYGGGTFVAGGADGEMAYSTDNGITWTAVADSKFDSTNRINTIAYGNNKFVAVGRSGTMSYSSDGITWTAVADSKFGTSEIRGFAFANGTFVAGGASGKMAYSSDGITWTAVADSKFGTTAILSIAYGNSAGNAGRFVAGGQSGKMAYSSDGITWTAGTFSSSSNYNYAIAYGNGRFVAGGNSGKMEYCDW